MSQKNITYIIGAGASYNSLPVVDSMNQRIQTLLHILNPKNQSSNISKYKTFTEKLYTEFNRLMVEASKHRTIDTYAKKLWLTNREDDLSTLKMLLDLYFTFEQDLERSIYEHDEIFKVKNGKKNIWSDIGTVVDFRYDVFLATLLDKSLLLPSNIKIITWNYDNQIEIAYQEYLQNSRSSNVINNLGIYPNHISNAEENYKLIRLNGQSNFYEKDTENHIGLSSKLDNMLENTWKEYKTSISFAWEESIDKSERIRLAKEIMQQTEELIVIGYSFPSFNRTIDAALFSQLVQFEKITVQCLQQDYEGISASIADMNIFHSDEHFERAVKLHHNLEQFYIPSHQLM